MRRVDSLEVSDAGRDWGQEEKETTEDEMAGWHHRLDGCGFGWTPGVGDGQGRLACCDSRGHRESDTTEGLNWNKTVVPNDRIHSKLDTHGALQRWCEKCTDGPFYYFVQQHSLVEKAMATHSSILAWRIPWTEKPGRLQSMGSLSRTWLCDFTFMRWRRK